ncbi:adenosine deaminase 2-like isoform X2 [Lineus longissimus]|uniref:adenosine deaminase 2-like isoform X2 n=1 Tax=Lineus longissimus TaxID=88925 RepID=UPI00315D0B7C
MLVSNSFIFTVFIVNFGLSTHAFDCNVNGCFRGPKDDYLRQRTDLIIEEISMKIGSDLRLSSAEEKINEMLMQYKSNEISSAMTTNLFPPAMHFFHAKGLIENSQVYRMIKSMPKGGALHLHDTSLVDANWLIKNVTYRPHCYVCFNSNSGTQRMKFFKVAPSDPDCPWQLVSNVRASYPTTAAYDEDLYHNMTLVTSNPQQAYPNEATAWKVFDSRFSVITELIMYKDVFQDYFYEALSEFYADAVQFVEVRCLLAPLVYDLDGKLYDEDWMIQAYEDVNRKFVTDHPDFSGSQIIFSAIRSQDKSDIASKVKQAVEFRQKYPDFVAGFDLVAWEQRGKPLIDFLDDLLYPSQLKPPVNLPYFFHAGETDWDGTSVDYNLYDAVLLNCSRIGHGYAVVKHPKILKMLKEKDIPIEVNPISNQVLHLVDDLRNHPAAFLIANNYSIVVSSDDPGIWGSDPLSHDFYEIFMGSAGAKGDLRFLKQLAINSIRAFQKPTGKFTFIKNHVL